MNKESYITELRNRLRGLRQEEIDDVIAYCEEYFEEAGVENEQQVIDELGTPVKYAAQIKAEAAIRRNESDRRQQRDSYENKNPNTSMKSVMAIFLGLCALPLALPLMLALICVMFAFVVVIFALIFAAVMSAVAIFISGVPLIISGITNMSVPGNGLVAIGGGCMTIGIGILLTAALVSIIRVMIPAFSRAITRLYNKAKGGRRHEEA